MTTPFLYHSVEPENSKASYTEYDNVDFVMNFEGRKLICNTVRLEGLLRVTTAGANLPTPGGNIDKRIYLDPSVGIHSVLDGIQTSILTLGSVENFNGYSRYVGMTEDCTTFHNDMCNSENLSELKFPFLDIMPSILTGEEAVDDANLNNPNSFSFKPQFVLNTASQINNQGLGMSFNKTGTIRVVFS